MKRLIIIFAFGLILSNQVFGNTFSKNEVCDNIYQILNTKYDEFDILIGEILSSNKILKLPSEYLGNVSLLVYSDDGVLIDTKSINNTKLIKNVSITPDEITITLSNSISAPTNLSIISLDTVSSSYITDILPDETEIKIPRSSLIDGCYYTFILSSQNIILDFIKIINTL